MFASRRLFGFAIAATATTAVTGTGCERIKATEYVAGFSTQVQVPREFKTLEVSVFVSNDPTSPPALVECARVDVVNGRARLPKTLGVARETDNRSMMVSVVAYEEPRDDVNTARGDCYISPVLPDSVKQSDVQKGVLKPRVLRRSRQNYRDGRILYLPMPLKYACFDVSCACPTGQTKMANGDPCETPGGPQTDITCAAGRCVSALRDERVFRDYAGDLSTGESSVCFSVQRCLADGVVPTLENAEDCTYSVPGTLDGMNVRAIFEGFITEVLDEDKMPPGFDELSDTEKQKISDDIALHAEGYTRLGNGRFRLAKGLCDLTKPDVEGQPPKVHRIVSLAASRTCQPKAPDQPICDEKTDVLIPTANQVVLVLDRSQPMQDNFLKKEDAVLSKALGVGLDDPAFTVTQLGFRWAPDEGTTACPTVADFTRLNVPYNSTLRAKDRIVAELAKNSTIGGAAPSASLQNVLHADGIYATFANPTALAADLPPYLRPVPIARKAVVVITNNDVGLGCAGEDVVAQVAAQVGTAATQKGIKTFIIQLGRSGETASDHPDRVRRAEHAAALANAQPSAAGTGCVTTPTNGAVCFDASSGSKEETELVQGVALGSITAELQSCLYEKPPSLDPNNTNLGFNVVIGGQVQFRPVKFDAACKEGATVDGWGIEENSRIRLCGAACDQLRATIVGATASALQQSLQNSAAPIQPNSALIQATQAK